MTCVSLPLSEPSFFKQLTDTWKLEVVLESNVESDPCDKDCPRKKPSHTKTRISSKPLKKKKQFFNLVGFAMNVRND